MRMGRLKRDTHSNLFGLNISNEEKSILTLTQYNKTFFFVHEKIGSMFLASLSQPSLMFEGKARSLP